MSNKKILNTKSWSHERLVPEGLPWYNKQMLYDHLDRYFFAQNFVANKVVLDIACGSGYGTQLLAKGGAKQVTGIDISIEAVSYARKYYGLKNVVYKIGDAEAIKEQRSSFDAVISFETLEHLLHPEKFLKEVTRVLKQDGIFIVSTPNRLLNTENSNPFHLKEFSLDELHSILSKNFSSIFFYGQKPVHAPYLSLVNQITSRIPPGFIHWIIDTGFKVVFRGSKVQPLDTFRIGFVPSYFIALCKK